MGRVRRERGGGVRERALRVAGGERRVAEVRERAQERRGRAGRELEPPAPAPRARPSRARMRPASACRSGPCDGRGASTAASAVARCAGVSARSQSATSAPSPVAPPSRSARAAVRAASSPCSTASTAATAASSEATSGSLRAAARVGEEPVRLAQRPERVAREPGPAARRRARRLDRGVPGGDEQVDARRGPERERDGAAEDEPPVPVDERWRRLGDGEQLLAHLALVLGRGALRCGGILGRGRGPGRTKRQVDRRDVEARREGWADHVARRLAGHEVEDRAWAGAARLRRRRLGRERRRRGGRGKDRGFRGRRGGCLSRWRGRRGEAGQGAVERFGPRGPRAGRGGRAGRRSGRGDAAASGRDWPVRHRPLAVQLVFDRELRLRGRGRGGLGRGLAPGAALRVLEPAAHARVGGLQLRGAREHREGLPEEPLRDERLADVVVGVRARRLERDGDLELVHRALRVARRRAGRAPR